MSNRLADATSPYLLQHAENPIDWWQWSEDAFADARRREVPVLLSIGYAACHWCHVMAHESFSDETLAAQVNRDFVAIKVDREERPDIDAVYMAATLAMTGHGGWPMTCFLTPDGQPFHCGTYFPPEPRMGMPGFGQLLTEITKVWQSEGVRVREAAGRISEKLAAVAAATHQPGDIDAAGLDNAADLLASQVDPTNGGFGGAPKFPPSMALEFLLRHFERTGSPRSLQVVGLTCERMARGGLYDQLAGGFARYSVDTAWVVPHFEKMLYDNALLLRLYAHLAARTGADLPRRVTEDTVAFLLREMRTAQRGFASALDADTDGVEGLTYAWTPAQLVEVLGEQDGQWAAKLLTVTAGGTFEHGSSTLQLPADPDDPARWDRVRQALLTARDARPQPARDDKVITAWNGLTIAALADAGAAFERPEWVQAAADAAELLLSIHLVDGRLRRSSRSGVVGAAMGVLEDHGCLADGLLALHQATGSARWLDAATMLLDLALAHFADPGQPGVYLDTADDAEALLHRPREITDNTTPAGASALTGALLTASVLVEPQRSAGYRGAAEAALRAVGALVVQYPNAAGHWLTVAEAATRGPLQIAVVGEHGDAVRAALSTQAHQLAPGGTVVVTGEPDQQGVPLLADRPLVGGSAVAYVCRGFVCDRPAGSTEELAAALR